MKIGIQTIRKHLTASSIDAFLVSSYANVSYLTNFFGFSKYERDAYVLVTQKSWYLFTNPLYEHSFSSKNMPYKLQVTKPSLPFSKLFQKTCHSEDIVSIAFEEDHLTVSEFSKMQKDGIDFIPDTLSHLRIIKDHPEIERMRLVCKLTDTVYEELLQGGIKEGITESELAKRLEILALKHNTAFSFPAIVAFGQNAAIPHHHTGESKLKKNDTILIDFGLVKDNYCSDMTRTVFFGKYTDKQKKAYDAVQKAQAKAKEHIIKTLKNSEHVSASEVDKVAREYIIKEGFPSIPHSLGHGIGIEVHEAPSLSPKSDDLLKDGMIFSIEPGVYLPGEQGIRIEDLFVIQNNKLHELTNSSKNLTTL